MIKKYIAAALTIILLAGCGKKGPPLPNASLAIPQPVWMELNFEEEGVKIYNPSTTNPVIVEKTISEFGDLSFPVYRKLVTLAPGGSFTDTNTEENVRYIYRFRARHERYDAYSDAVSRSISYKRRVAVENVSTELNGDILCVDTKLSPNAHRADVLINGRLMPAEQACHKLPEVEKILLVIVPYAEDGTPGQAYSTTIEYDLTNMLLPPQNIRIIRSGSQIILSWNTSEIAIQYKILAGNMTILTDSTLYTYKNAPDTCIDFTFISIDKNGRESSPAIVTSCP